MSRVVKLWKGDCLERLLEIPDGTVGAFICDPPYDLTQASRRGSPRPPGSGPFGRHTLATHGHDRGVGSSGGFMGKTWDATGIAFDPEFWHLAFRKLCPGGVVKAFGGTRTHHRMLRVVEQAGFVDACLEAWVYGSGFPKSTNISKQIDRRAGAPREVVGYKRGVGGENLNDLVRGSEIRQTTDAGGRGMGAYGTGARQVPVDVPVTVPTTELAKLWSEYGTALKPAWEPVVIARKP